MGTGLLDLSDRIIRGDAAVDSFHPFRPEGGLEEVDDGVAFVPSFANVTAVRTGDGVVLFDTGSNILSGDVHSQVRRWCDDRVDTVVFTHGHIDHVFGVDRYEADAEERGHPPLRVVAHELVPARFDRYRETAGYNGTINARQFRMPGLTWPTDYRYPDETYRDDLVLELGGERIELHHARGETDDATWAWLPDRRTVVTGDLFIWASPNCGNPQKVQRYPSEWAAALRAMAALDPELLLPGHGLPIQGRDQVVTALIETAELLESLVRQTLDLMNTGARLDEIVHAVRAPAELLAKPYLRPVYDEPEFVVRNVWRLYGGWYDGNPAHLKPASEAALAGEIAALTGGAARLAERARELAGGDDADQRLAGHLAELAGLAAPDDPAVQRARAEVYEARAAAERSTMSIGVFRWAATEARDSA